jgi:hypothetical protein
VRMPGETTTHTCWPNPQSAFCNEFASPDHPSARSRWFAGSSSAPRVARLMTSLHFVGCSGGSWRRLEVRPMFFIPIACHSPSTRYGAYYDRPRRSWADRLESLQHLIGLQEVVHWPGILTCGRCLSIRIKYAASRIGDGLFSSVTNAPYAGASFALRRTRGTMLLFFRKPQCFR